SHKRGTDHGLFAAFLMEAVFHSVRAEHGGRRRPSTLGAFPRISVEEACTATGGSQQVGILEQGPYPGDLQSSAQRQGRDTVHHRPAGEQCSRNIRNAASLLGQGFHPFLEFGEGSPSCCRQL